MPARVGFDSVRSMRGRSLRRARSIADAKSLGLSMPLLDENTAASFVGSGGRIKGSLRAAMSSADHVTRLTHAGREILIVGTAHISRQSVEEVARVIETERPDTVCVELDSTRYAALVDEERAKRLDAVRVVRERRALFTLAMLVLTSYQRRLGDRVGVRPGAEMLAATEAARRVGARLVLADRDVHVTVARSFRNLSLINRAKLVAILLFIPFAADDISEEQIEELKDRETIGDLMTTFAQQMPDLQAPLIDERDRFLMSVIQEAEGPKIVAVVGMAHVRGMTGYLGQTIDRVALNQVPSPAFLARADRWVPAALAVAAMAFGAQARPGSFEKTIVGWAAANSAAAAVLSVAAGGALVTMLAAAALAPIAPFMPRGAHGSLVGRLEARLRPPRAEDSATALQAVTSLRTARKNGFVRLLLVSAAATLAERIGAWAGLVWVLAQTFMR